MLLRESKGKDSQNKTRDFLEIECDNCKEVYTRAKRHYNSAFHGCSPKCLNILKGITIKTTCSECGQEILRKSSQVSRSKSGLFFCSKICKDKAVLYMEEIRPEHYNTTTTKYRLAALRFYGKKCQLCGFDKEAALVVHHKDQNRSNNEISNLQVLCANCHYLIHEGKFNRGLN